MSLFTVSIMMLVALLTAGTADVAAVFAARQRAIIAAEAAALAAADAATWLNDASPSSEASRFARANGAELALCSCAEGSTRVTVEVVTDPDVRLIEPWKKPFVTVSRSAVVEAWVPSWSP